MKKPSKFLTLAALLLAGAARSDAPAQPMPMEAAQVAHLKDAKWVAPKPKEFPPGVLVSPIAVDPQTGASMGYGKFPPGAALPMHWHSFTEYTVLLSGNATFTVDGKAIEMSAGDYIVIPPKVPHSLSCSAKAECVLITRRAGATDYHFVN